MNDTLDYQDDLTIATPGHYLREEVSVWVHLGIVRLGLITNHLIILVLSRRKVGTMTLGSHHHRKASLHRQAGSDALLLLPKSSTLNSLNQGSRDNEVFSDYLASEGKMPYGETECMLVKNPNKSVTIHSSVVMERRRTIGAKLSSSNGNLNNLGVAYSGQGHRRGPIDYLRNKLPCFKSRDSEIDVNNFITDPEVTIIREDADNLSDISDRGRRSRKVHHSSCQPCELWFEPSSRATYWWSFAVCCAVLYNYWIIIYRHAFDEINMYTLKKWFILDYTMDLIYLLDICKGFRTAYLEEGVLQTNTIKMRVHYMNSMLFYIDCLCLLPLDFLYLSIGFKSLLRCFRLIKIYKIWKFLDTTERHTNYPNLVRTASMLHYLIMIFHWNASLFFTVMDNSSAFKNDDFDKDTASVGMRYLHSLYWSVMSLSTISKLPHPKDTREYIYTIITMIGALLLFATIMGMVAHIVSSMHSARKEFQARLDDVKTYMAQSSVPNHLQSRVIRWFDYLWQVKKNVNKTDTFDLLPDRLKAEIAIHIHLDTLKKVEIFQNTEAGFLKELVLRLEPVLFSPGDLVCRKGEVGKEMYIVKKGRLHVVDVNDNVLATLQPGSYFGEISILNMGDVGNRRTASVKSVGYSDLFCLKKGALWDVLKDYPNAQMRLESIAVKRLQREEDNSKQKQKQTVKPFFQSENSHPALAPKHSIASTSSRTVEALQLPEVTITTSPAVSRKSSFITNELHIARSRQSSFKSNHSSDLTRSVQSSNTSLHHAVEPRIRHISPIARRKCSETNAVEYEDETVIVETAT